MQRIKHISIPTPCTEDWQLMTAVEQGRHCQSCCKTVIDFTAMSNAEVISYLASHKNTCGRITDSKLASVNNELDFRNRKRFTWKGLIAAASLGMLFPAIHAKAQSQPKTEQAPLSPESFPLGRIAPTDSVTYITITGVVKAKDDGLPVPGASVTAKGSSTGTTTKVDGSFTLKVPKKTKRITVNFIGYKPWEVKLKNIEDHQNIVLSPVLETAYLGGMEVIVYFYFRATRACAYHHQRRTHGFSGIT